MPSRILGSATALGQFQLEANAASTRCVAPSALGGDGID